MDDCPLSFNQVIRIDSKSWKGVFRVISLLNGHAALYLISRLSGDQRIPLRLSYRLEWHQIDDLERLRACGELRALELIPDLKQEDQTGLLKGKDREHHQKALDASLRLLDPLEIRKALISKRNLNRLHKELASQHSVSKTTVENWINKLCLRGFSASTLKPRSHARGGAGKPRPWGEMANRKKPGRRTNKERADRAAGEHLEEHKGWTFRQERMLIAKYRALAKPGRSFASTYPELVESVFSTRARETPDGLKMLPPELGTYPNTRATRRIIDRVLGPIQRAQLDTSPRYFANNLRGSTGRAYRGVAGPGYQFGIDATIGDIYLRSAINRAWYVGRPIIYLLIDTWSTAIVGVHVCLNGPSWDSARLGLFSALAPAQMCADAVGLPLHLGLNPAPAAPYLVVADRGEMFSRAASGAARELGFTLKITPAYRPYLKGWQETGNRIPKNSLYTFVHGAINARRKEAELRNFDPRSGVFTLRDFLEYLVLCCLEYNLTADRRPRLTTEMVAQHVHATPAGLWAWGHSIGLGYQKAIPPSQLITNLLSKATLRITRNGAMLGSLLYDHEVLRGDNWVTNAALTGTFEKPAWLHPHCIQNLWVPDAATSSIHQFQLSVDARAKPTDALDEVLDAFVFETHNNAQFEHLKTFAKAEFQGKRRSLHDQAVLLTRDADGDWTGEKPSVREARSNEKIHPGNVAEERAVEVVATGESQSPMPPNHGYSDIIASTLDDMYAAHEPGAR